MTHTTASGDQQKSGFLRQVARRVLDKVQITLRGLGVPSRILGRNTVGQRVVAHMEEGDAGGRIFAVCDFAAFPLSYDIVYFLSAADAFRRNVGAKWMDVAFLAHHSDPLNPLPQSGNPVEAGDYKTFVHNIGIGAARLFPSVGNVSFFTNRASFLSLCQETQKVHRLFPEDYSPLSPQFSPNPGEPPLYGLAHTLKYNEPPEVAFSIRPPQTHLELVRAWISRNVPNKKIVTITLRETPYQESRNSNIPEWQKLIDHYRGNPDIRFVLLRDYYSVYADTVLGGDNVIECPEAVLNLPFRAALYEEAALNLFVANGPAALCIFNPRTRYIVFDMGGPEPSARPEDVSFQHGLESGENIRGASPFQRLVWEEDKFPIMRTELDFLFEGLSKQ